MFALLSLERWVEVDCFRLFFLYCSKKCIGRFSFGWCWANITLEAFVSSFCLPTKIKEVGVSNKLTNDINCFLSHRIGLFVRWLERRRRGMCASCSTFKQPTFRFPHRKKRRKKTPTLIRHQAIFLQWLSSITVSPTQSMNLWTWIQAGKY